MSVDPHQLSHRLQGARFFDGVDVADRIALVQLMVHDTFVADEVIIRQETFTRNLWLVLDGECEVVKQPSIGSYGTPVPLAQLQTLDVFGEMSLILPEPHVASVEAKTKVCTLRLRGGDFDELLDKEPRLGCRLLKNLLQIQSGRLRAIDGKLSRYLDRHEDLKVEDTWKELQKRLGRLYS